MSDILKIYFVTSNPFPDYSGGIETWMYNIILRLPRDISVFVVSPCCNSTIQYNNFPELDDRVNYIRYETLAHKRITRIFTRGPFAVIGNIYAIMQIKRKLGNVLKNEDGNIVFCVDPVVSGTAVNEIRKKKKFTYINSIRGPHSEVMAGKRKWMLPLYRSWERKSVLGCDLVLANGLDTKEAYEALYGRPLKVLKNGVDFSRTNAADPSEAVEIDDSKPSIVSVATLLPIKGVFDLVDGIKSYTEKYGRDVHAYFVGKGNAQALMTYAKTQGIDDCVTCLGYRSNPMAYMKKATINVCMSGGSGFSMSMLEAMSSKKPIVALDTHVYRQFNERGELTLVEEKNPGAFADAIHEIVNNYEDYLKKCDSAYEIASKFDWKYVIQDFMQYLECMEND